MVIKALPDSTIHLLGSSQVLSTPISLVKELIDNALDAKATSIDILISQNTIDKIEVRDNGHGIQEEDLGALGRRGYTSKLATSNLTLFEDLRNIGGGSLGFRGEALASTCQMGRISVTTRMDGQPVATCVRLKPTGGIESQSRTSHPIGTTISVTDLFAKLPVRKQTSMKEAPKVLARIQELLKAYALARVSIKLNLKIVKGGKGSWSYAPRPHAGIKEAVSLVIGRDASIQCIESSLAFPESIPLPPERLEAASTSDSTATGSRFLLEAFLPRVDADIGKLGGGQYLSVDSRPVSHEKGTMKKIVTTFKKYLRSSSIESPDKIKNPFIRLNIVCPKASYDPNVEPLKDDVLFEDETFILEIAEKMFRNLYGDCAPKLATTNQAQKKADFDILLARKPNLPILMPKTATLACAQTPTEENIDIDFTEPFTATEPVPGTDNTENESTNLGKHRWGFDMSSDLTEYTNDRPQRNWGTKGYKNVQNQGSSNEQQPSDSANSNPWTIAKMSAPVHEGRGRDKSVMNTGTSPRLSTGSSPDGIRKLDHRNPSAAISPSQNASDEHDYGGMNEALQSSRVYWRGRLQDNRDKSLQLHDLPHPSVEHDLPEGGHEQRRLGQDFIAASDLAETTLISPPNTSPLVIQQSKRPRTQGANRPFVPPFRIPVSGTQSDDLFQTSLTPNHQPFRVQREARQAQSLTAALGVEQSSADVEWAMEFENRKEAATRRRRDELLLTSEESSQPSSTSHTSARPSPHKNRYNAALASLEVPQDCARGSIPEINSENFNTTLPDSDPRGYLMKRQKSFSTISSITGGPRKLRRAQTMRLPFETIPDELQLHSLLQTIPICVDDVQQGVAETSGYDMYVCRGIINHGLDMGGAEKDVMGQKLCYVVKKWMGSDKGQKCDVEFMFGNLGLLQGD